MTVYKSEWYTGCYVLNMLCSEDVFAIKYNLLLLLVLVFH